MQPHRHRGDAASRAHREDADVWSICFQSAEEILPTEEDMSPSLRERVGCGGRSEERDLHHRTPTRRAPVGSNTRGEVLRRSPRPLLLRTAQRSGGGRGGTSFPSTGHMVNARALRAEHR